MPHIHIMPNGSMTGTEIIDPKNGDLHWHMVDGVKTESSAFGPNHTHFSEGSESSKPEEKSSGEELEVKHFSGHVVECKQEERNGVPIGIVKGYIATWDLDRGRDRFERGAFLDSIGDHIDRKRQLRLKDHHGRTVGGFPFETLSEDEKGLFGIGEINLEVQQGREAFSLAKQGVLSDFSVGFVAEDFEYANQGMDRVIKKAVLFEGSIVDEPMNQRANITEVKSVVPFQDLPLASRERRWDADAALGRVRKATGSEESPSGTYRQAFLWFDRENAKEFDGYKLPIVDVVNGNLTVIPRAIFAAAAAMQGARGGVDIPEGDTAGVIRHIERYYEKMDIDSPFDEKSFSPEVTVRNIEQALKVFGFSRAEAKSLSSRIKLDNSENDEDTSYKDLLSEVKNLTESLKAN